MAASAHPIAPVIVMAKGSGLAGWWNKLHNEKGLFSQNGPKPVEQPMGGCKRESVQQLCVRPKLTLYHYSTPHGRVMEENHNV